MWRMSRRDLLSIMATSIISALGCSASSRSSFQPTDPTFKPKAGPAPRVYLEANIADVPNVPMRTVGVISVTVPESSGIKSAIDVAVAKGQELGCWILVEHSAFEALPSHSQLTGGARIFLAHGGGGGDTGHAQENTSGGSVTAEFDCVLQRGEPTAKVARRNAAPRRAHPAAGRSSTRWSA